MNSGVDFIHKILKIHNENVTSKRQRRVACQIEEKEDKGKVSEKVLKDILIHVTEKIDEDNEEDNIVGLKA